MFLLLELTVLDTSIIGTSLNKVLKYMYLPSVCGEEFKATILHISGRTLYWADSGVPELAFVSQCTCVGHRGVLKYFWGQILMTSLTESKSKSAMTKKGQLFLHWDY